MRTGILCTAAIPLQQGERSGLFSVVHLRQCRGGSKNERREIVKSVA